MAKRRTEQTKAREKKRLEKKAGMVRPAGQSNYALKKKGQREAKQDPNRRASWMVRSGLVALADRAAANDSINVAA